MNLSFKLCVAAATMALLFGCADTHQLVRQVNAGNTKLTASDSIYISVSRDGVYGEDVYKGSGATTTEMLTASFAKRADKVEEAQLYQGYDDSLKVAQAKHFRYLVIPIILHWEDRATAWSGIPDRVSVKVSVIDAPTGKPIGSAIISGKSGLATFGGDHPQDLLPKPIEEFVSSLY